MTPAGCSQTCDAELFYEVHVAGCIRTWKYWIMSTHCTVAMQENTKRLSVLSWKHSLYCAVFHYLCSCVVNRCRPLSQRTNYKTRLIFVFIFVFGQKSEIWFWSVSNVILYFLSAIPWLCYILASVWISDVSCRAYWYCQMWNTVFSLHPSGCPSHYVCIHLLVALLF